MSSLPTLDISGIFEGSIGTRVGIRRSDVRSAMTRVREQHVLLEESMHAGLLPHLMPLPVLQAKSLGEPLAGRPIVLLGEPSATQAVAALATAHGHAPLLLDASDASGLSQAIALPDSVLVVLDGPSWVRLLAAELVGAFSTVLVFAGDGTGSPGWAPPGGQLIEFPGAADLRFAGLGLAALTLLAASGGDLDAVGETVSDMAKRCRLPGLIENPAYSLAASFLAMEEQSSITAPVLMVSARRLMPWASWLSNAWGTATVRTEVRGPLRQVRGDMGRIMCISDEAATQRLVAGERDLVVVSAFGARPLGVERSVGALLSTWRLSVAQREAHHLQLRRAGCPLVRLRMPYLDAASLAASAVLWLQAALAVGGSRGQDPLTLDAADSWRRILDEEILTDDVFADV